MLAKLDNNPAFPFLEIQDFTKSQFFNLIAIPKHVLKVLKYMDNS